MAPALSPLWTKLQETRSDNWLHLLNTGKEAMDWRLRLIDSASQSIDLQTFLWSDDWTGLAILKHITYAADRGVRIRILLDDSFTGNLKKAMHRIDQHPNIEFRIYNPYSYRFDSMMLRQLLNLGEFSRVDHRMHNKAMVIDNRAAIVGGRNLADEYFGRHNSANFRDLEVLFSGPAVVALGREFDTFWNNEWSFPYARLDHGKNTLKAGEFEERLKGSPWAGFSETPVTREQVWMQTARSAISGEVTVVADRPAETDPGAADQQPDQLAKEIINLMEMATEELIMVSAYLIPTPDLERAVEQTENRGVRVRILTNSLRSNNHVTAHSAYRHHVKRLAGHGAEVHEVRALAKDRSLYMENPVAAKHLALHAKVLLIDDNLTYVGSANLDPRSLRLNTEMGLLIKGARFNRLVREALAIDFDRRNSWHLQIQQDGNLAWIADDVILHKQPAESAFQRIEDWFLGILPIEDEM